MLKFFFRKLFQESEEIRFSASSLAFSTLLSLIPFLIVIMTFFQSFGVFENIYPRIENLIFESMKEATGVTVTKYLRTTIGNFQLKTIGLTGAILLLFSSLALLKNIDVAFHRVLHLKMKTPFLKRTGFYWTILLMTPVILIIISSLASYDGGAFFNQSSGKKYLIFTGGTFLLWVMYKFIPEIKMSFLSTFIAAVISSLLLSVTQKSFLWLSLKIFKQNKIYGSLISLPIFLIWLLVVWYIILAGLSFCAFLQQKIFKRP